MNVYDFDKTIFKYDSSYLFVKYMMRKYPRLFIINCPKLFFSIYKYLSSKDITNVKENIFSFLRYIPNIDNYIDEFWLYAEQYIQNWYIEQKNDNDLIISASPYFLLNPIAKKYGFNLIATDMDKYSGNILGLNNKGNQKVLRFKEIYGNEIIDKFYSDSLSDQPLADISKQAFIVNDKEISPWPVN